MNLKKMFSKLALVLAVVMLLPLAACQKSSSDTKENLSKLEEIKKAGKIVLGTSPDYPPFEFIEEVNGKSEIVGFDIEIAKAIAKDLGVELEIKDMKFEGLLAALQTSNVDFVLAGMNPDPERAKEVDFSDIYYKAVQAVVIREEDAASIKSLEDLNGKTVGVQKGAVQEKIAADQIPGAKVKALGKISDLTLELKTKKIDALIVELPVASAYVSKNTDLKVSDLSLKSDEDGFAVAFQKDSTDLVNAVNATLKKLIDNGEIDKLYAEFSEKMENQ